MAQRRQSTVGCQNAGKVSCQTCALFHFIPHEDMATTQSRVKEGQVMPTAQGQATEVQPPRPAAVVRIPVAQALGAKRNDMCSQSHVLSITCALCPGEILLNLVKGAALGFDEAA